MKDYPVSGKIKLPMKKKILIIDDEPDLCQVLAIRFREKGFEVIIANDGLEGLNKAKDERPDIVILDLKLPKLPGEEVCREIRKDKAISSIPIIMLTAKDSDVDSVVGKVIGADSYMIKPFDTKRLLEEINRLAAVDK